MWWTRQRLSAVTTSHTEPRPFPLLHCFLTSVARISAVKLTGFQQAGQSTQCQALMVFICMTAVLHTAAVPALPDTIGHLGLNFSLSVNGLISMASSCVSITKQQIMIIIVAVIIIIIITIIIIIIMIIIIIIININWDAVKNVSLIKLEKILCSEIIGILYQFKYGVSLPQSKGTFCNCQFCQLGRWWIFQECILASYYRKKTHSECI